VTAALAVLVELTAVTPHVSASASLCMQLPKGDILRRLAEKVELKHKDVSRVRNTAHCLALSVLTAATVPLFFLPRKAHPCIGATAKGPPQ
jgi:hypothetical protein